MPDESLAGGPAPANRRKRRCCGGFDTNLFILLSIVWSFCLGASLMEVPIRNLTHRAVCRELSQLPADLFRNGTVSIEDPICQTDKMKNVAAEAQMIRQLAQAGGGLLFSYFTIKQADSMGRFASMCVGSIAWAISMSLVFIGLDDWSMGGCWFFATTGSLARALVEGSVLSMATDISDNNSRARIYTYVLSVALLAWSIVDLFTMHFPDSSNTGRSFFMSIFIVAMGTTTCLIRLFTKRDTRNEQRENWQEENPPAAANPSPFQRLCDKVSTALQGSGTCLVFVAAAVVPLAAASATSFKVYMRAAFTDVPETPMSKTANWFTVPVSIFGAGCVTYIFNLILSGQPRWSIPHRRDLQILGGALVVFVLGCFLSIMPNWSVAFMGMTPLVAGLAAIFPYSAALLLDFVGPRVRSKFAARVWGFVYLCRSALTLVILPPMNIYSRKEPGSAKQFIFMLILGGFIVLFACRARRIWPKAQRPEDAQAEDIELQVLNGDLPQAPPPAYQSGVPN